MLPTYPNFKKLDIDDQEEIHSLTRKFQPYSDFNFASLFSYNINNSFEVSNINGNLAIMIEDYVTDKCFYSILGNNDIPNSLMQFADLHRPNYAEPLLRLVPEDVLKNNRRKLNPNFNIEPDPDNFDYIISVKHLVNLIGRKYSTKRQRINQFKKLYPHSKTLQIDISAPHIQKEILKLFFEWAAIKSVTEKESAREYNALIRYFSLKGFINSIDIGLYIDDKLIGFTLNEVAHSYYYIGHFGKANYNYPGAFQVLEHETAKILRKYKCRYMNFEQDLGIDGLKESKLSWHPIKFLKKYNIYLKQGN